MPQQLLLQQPRPAEELDRIAGLSAACSSCCSQASRIQALHAPAEHCKFCGQGLQRKIGGAGLWQRQSGMGGGSKASVLMALPGRAVGMQGVAQQAIPQEIGRGMCV